VRLSSAVGAKRFELFNRVIPDNGPRTHTFDGACALATEPFCPYSLAPPSFQFPHIPNFAPPVDRAILGKQEYP
jgi:hypothetical protein